MSAAEQNASKQPRRGRAALPRVLALTLAVTMVTLAAIAQGAAAQGPRLAVDADHEGNRPDHLGPLNRCLSVASGQTFSLDIVIEDVDDLLAWELYLEYDPAVLQVVDRDVDLFQAANGGSNVYDVSERVPDSDGRYRVAAADTADPPSPDSGSGILATLTVKAVGPGSSSASLARRDLDGDGRTDLGPFLRNADAEPIGDDDGDTFFDGPLDSAQIAVDTPCPPGSEGAGTAGRPGSSDGGVSPVYILGISLSAAAVATVSALLFLYRRRARAQPH